jgi:hypothetical protein
MDDKLTRQIVIELLAGKGAHADWRAAFAKVPAKFRGQRPQGAPHSLWELLEHMRIAQWDILQFSRDSKHVSPDWPSGYWPKSAKPKDGKQWDASLRAFERDLEAMKSLVGDQHTDLLARIPHGDGQTVLREALLVADHNAYHLGQVVLIRRLLNNWKD